MAPDREGDFLSGYGPNGEWSRLFSRADGYLGTELVECDEPGGYMTIDRWHHEADFDGAQRPPTRLFDSQPVFWWRPDRAAAMTDSIEIEI